MLVGSSTNTNWGTRSHYECNGSNAQKGMRVKLTYTFSGIRVQACPFVTISGLRWEEMPVDSSSSGLLALHIKGLYIAEGGGTVGAKGKGYVVFVRNDKDGDKDKKRVRFYCNKVLLPFVSEFCKDYDRWQEGMHITDDIQVVSRCDGNNAQIQSIINSINECDTYRIFGMKQNSARTGTEEAAKLCRVFQLMKKLHRRYSVMDTPDEFHPLKGVLVSEFDHFTRGRIIKLPP